MKKKPLNYLNYLQNIVNSVINALFDKLELVWVNKPVNGKLHPTCSFISLTIP